MDRDGQAKLGSTPDSAPPQTKNRFTSPLVINSASKRRSLFSRPQAKEDPVRPTSSGSPAESRVPTSSNTKIPRPSQRRPFTLSDAYRMAAEEEEVAQASPSPAPRSWRSRREPSEKKPSKSARTGSFELQRAQGLHRPSLESGGGNGPDDVPVPSHQSDTSDSTFDEKLRQYALDNAGEEAPTRRGNGLLARSRLGNRIVETGRGLVRKASRSGVDHGSSPRPPRTTTNGTWLSRRLSERKRSSSDASSNHESADWGQADDNLQDGALQPGTTPNKSFAWPADADFTANDLQVSDSPPVIIGRSNTKIDRIRALEAEIKESSSESSEHWARNSRVDKIRALEADAGSNFDDDPAESAEAVDGIHEEKPEVEREGQGHTFANQTSTTVKGSRLREIERLSRRALASARLDELGENNAENSSHLPSPDLARTSTREPLRSISPLRERLRRLDNEAPATAAHNIPAPASPTSVPSAVRVQNHPSADATDTGNRGVSENREPYQIKPQTDDDPCRDVGEDTRQRRPTGGGKTGVRPSVGFAGLPRSASVESRLAKRASFVHSDSDPTERIEGERNLFAPTENQSERGSLRAPSPEPEQAAIDETPKPAKPDPLTQPTPRVTGAYVETPATVKVEKLEDSIATGATEKGNAGPETTRPKREITDGDPNIKLSHSGEDEAGTAMRQQKRAQSARGDRLPSRSSSISARRRVRSLSRGRRPLINSAKPPTVKDDLLEIHRANQIDDSTLEDIADLMAQLGDSASLSDSPEAKSGNDSSERPNQEKELEVFDRLSRSLKTGLLGIRSAKQGIERLEGKVLHADIKETRPSDAVHGGGIKNTPPPCTVCHGRQPTAHETVTYVHFPVPRLWHRRPKFRFTLLGLLLFTFSLWYIAESGMCYLYCKPEFCYSGRPCRWSPDDPAWGYAIPVKLDQWVTGGQGRQLVRRFQPEVADWLADLWDAATGTDITMVNTALYSAEQMRQHRRRLAKRGIVPQFRELPEDQELFDEWSAVRQAQEQAQSAREMGYEVEEEDESIADDETV
ncbi:hypothetical protein VTK26DRAFT_4761 [Humicola hyalothermophila]